MAFKDYAKKHRVTLIRDYTATKRAQRRERIAWLVFASIIVSWCLFFTAWIILIK